MFGNIGNTLKKMFQRKQDKERIEAKTIHMEAPKPKTSKADEIQQAYKNYRRKAKRSGLKPMRYKTYLARQRNPLKMPSGFNFPPIKPIPQRTDFSQSADIYRQRLRGERPTREEHRRMARMRHRLERNREERRIRTLAA